ncbi:MAG: Asp-tRNA(Asn)/Glu-tRNA(Gln) amidotransferase subunit GatC [Candidatus Paceibacterota bacterium]
MNKDDVQHLANLSRIELSDRELESFTKEISDILSYVGKVQALVADEVDTEPVLGARYNIFRKDVVTNDPDSHTEALLAEMPAKQGRYLEVKKILNIE